ncbi:unnamed protein product [Lampetra planeri]
MQQCERCGEMGALTPHVALTWEAVCGSGPVFVEPRSAVRGPPLTALRAHARSTGASAAIGDARAVGTAINHEHHPPRGQLHHSAHSPEPRPREGARPPGPRTERREPPKHRGEAGQRCTVAIDQGLPHYPRWNKPRHVSQAVQISPCLCGNRAL